MKKFQSICAATICLGITTASVQAGPQKPPPANRQFTREEFMVMNLDRGERSTGAQLADSLKEVRAMVRDLDRSLRQLQQVDKEFAKSKGRPDDRFLGPATDRVEQALKSAQQLEKDLSSSREELKDSIHQALIMAPR